MRQTSVSIHHRLLARLLRAIETVSFGRSESFAIDQEMRAARKLRTTSSEVRPSTKHEQHTAR